MSSWRNVRAPADKNKAVATNEFRGLSIIYITFRENCKFEWFAEPLKKQTEGYPRELIEIIVVDGLLNEADTQERRDYFKNLVDDKFKLTHVPPKPTAWQGLYRITDVDYFTAANTRNTGAAYAAFPSLVFIDDLGCIGSNWFRSVYEASLNNEINCGAYTKAKDMKIHEGQFVSGDTRGGVDSRLGIFPHTKSICSGQHMFGSSFTIPKSLYYEVNGQNEMYAGVGGEDYDLGIRLERSGYKLYYNKNMFIHESDTAFGSDLTRKCKRVDPEVSREHYNRILSKFNINDLISTGRRDLSHFLLSYSMYGPLRANKEFSLEDYNRRILAGMNPDFEIPIPGTIHFFTEMPIDKGI